MRRQRKAKVVATLGPSSSDIYEHTSQIAERKNRAWLTREHDAAVELQAALIRKVQTMSPHEKASVSKPGFL